MNEWNISCICYTTLYLVKISLWKEQENHNNIDYLYKVYAYDNSRYYNLHELIRLYNNSLIYWDTFMQGRSRGAGAHSVRSPAPLDPPNEITLCRPYRGNGEPSFWVPASPPPLELLSPLGRPLIFKSLATPLHTWPCLIEVGLLSIGPGNSI